MSKSTTSCVDVASYVVETRGAFTSSNMHRLLYYCYAWHLVWYDEPLFEEKIEAWASGPIIRSFWDLHAGKYTIGEKDEFLKTNYALTPEQKETVHSVFDFYVPRFNAEHLAHLSMSESPWRTARSGLKNTERGNSIIKDEWMKDYYSSIKTEIQK